MITLKEYILELISKALEESSLKGVLEDEFTDEIKKEILSAQVKLWLKDNSPDDNDPSKDYFNLSSGKLFEHYVVKLFDYEKWKLVSWRSDKIETLKGEPIKPETNQYPDIILEYCLDKEYNGFKKGDRIAIECKWTCCDKINPSPKDLAKCAKKKISKDNFYPKNALKDNACCLYYAIGVGWNNNNEQLEPKAVYFIPANKINNLTIEETKEYLLKKKESLICKVLDKNGIEEIISDLQNRLNYLKQDLIRKS